METVCVEQIERNQLLSLPRLLNNRMLELRQQFLSSRPRRNRDEVMGLQQNLFGSHDKKENLCFAQKELAKAPQAFCQRWNFDIDAGKPKEGPYKWKLLREQRELGATGRLTCLTALSSAASNVQSSSPKSVASSPKAIATSPTVLPSSSSASTTTFSTSTTPTAVISKKCVKRLQKSVPNKVPKLITDYFKESKNTTSKNKNIDVSEDQDSVSSRVVEILKIRSMNVR